MNFNQVFNCEKFMLACMFVQPVPRLVMFIYVVCCAAAGNAHTGL